jgi:hypothetical protein
LHQGEDGTDRGARKIKQLHDNANYFRARLQQLGLHVLGDWDSPVMPIMVYHLCYISGISRRCLEVGQSCSQIKAWGGLRSRPCIFLSVWQFAQV